MSSLAGSSKRIFCPVPRPLLNGTIIGSHVYVSASIKYKCDEKFELRGPELRLCQRNGKWSREDPHCQPKCKLARNLMRKSCFVVVVVYFILNRLLYLAYSANLGLLCMPHPGKGPLVLCCKLGCLHFCPRHL